MSLISVIIPAKNEARNVGATVLDIQKEFDKENIEFEIIVVNDGSVDETTDVIKKIEEKDQRIKIIDNHAPYGFGYAIRKGFNEFKGDYVIIAMADSSDDPKDMVRYVKEVQKGCDCCFGSRWGSGATVQNYPKFKYVLNRIVNTFINLLFQLGYNDVTNAFKCYSKEAIAGIRPILSRHFNITVELPLKAIVRGYSYRVISTNWYDKREGESSLKLQEMGSRYLFIIIYVLLEKLLCGSDYKKKQITS